MSKNKSVTQPATQFIRVSTIFSIVHFCFALCATKWSKRNVVCIFLSLAFLCRERELYSTPLISFSYLLSCEYLMPQNPHSHKMNTNIMQMYMCTSTWFILTKKANKIQTYQMGETNWHAPLFFFFFFFANFLFYC